MMTCRSQRQCLQISPRPVLMLLPHYLPHNGHCYCKVLTSRASECVFICVHELTHVHNHPFSPLPSSPHPGPLLHCEIYSKTALWESTHALPSLCTAPWQLLLYIPLQMRAMNRRDYRVEQEQRGGEGGMKKWVQFRAERERERGRVGRRKPVRGGTTGSSDQSDRRLVLYLDALL